MGFGDDCVWWHCVIVVSYNEDNIFYTTHRVSSSSTLWSLMVDTPILFKGLFRD